VRIAIIIGSIRDGRSGEAVGHWVKERADAHGGAEVELLDLKVFDVPLLTSSTVPAAAGRAYDDPRVTAWSQAIDAVDAYVFVTPEYNHGVPGAFKNAFDSIYPEWGHKAVGFVGYGSAGAARAVEQWRAIVSNAFMLDARGQVALISDVAWTDGAFTPPDQADEDLRSLLDELVPLAAAGATLRED
jgi:NAD(P)H-dependent FMN reductase